MGVMDLKHEFFMETNNSFLVFGRADLMCNQLGKIFRLSYMLFKYNLFMVNELRVNVGFFTPVFYILGEL